MIKNILAKIRNTPRKKLYIGIGVVFALIIIAVLIWIGYSAAKAINNISAGGFSLKQLFSSTSLKNENGRTNILLMGNGGSNHPGGQLTDTNILFSYNSNKKEGALISFPRDLYTSIAGTSEKNKLNYAYAYGEMNQSTTGGGGAAAKKTISEISGVPIHYYIVVDFVGFKELVDALGGVTVDVEKAINDPLYPKDYFDSNGEYHKTDAYSPFHLAAGVQKLDGTTALKYARSRESTSDFDRAGRQQKLLMAIRDKALSAGVISNPRKLVEITNILGNHIHTDLNVSEMKELASASKNLSLDKMKREVVDNGDSGLLVTDSSLGGYYLRPKGGSFKAIQELVKNIFTSGSSTEGSVAGAQTSAYGEGRIEIYNATGESGLARKTAPLLRAKGLTVTDLKTSSEDRDDTILYDYTSGYDSQSIAAIKSVVPDAKVIKRSDGDANIDFKLILGKDYIK